MKLALSFSIILIFSSCNKSDIVVIHAKNTETYSEITYYGITN